MYQFLTESIFCSADWAVVKRTKLFLLLFWWLERKKLQKTIRSTATSNFICTTPLSLVPHILKEGNVRLSKCSLWGESGPLSKDYHQLRLVDHSGKSIVQHKVKLTQRLTCGWWHLQSHVLLWLYQKKRILFLPLYRNFIFLVGSPLNSSLKVPVLWYQLMRRQDEMVKKLVFPSE